ncbi:hypothetical protein TUM4261_18240 [Shewanella sp. c952]|uniref:hypothetical protein n=1 Tax=Shewanella sp. c952 TaxID=2815913 RepID=UPI001BBD8DE9|nr:hypothetical protein [Shewanella sp. c952]GIU09626.1 hypothetical protein TUM4261_18240 [Shewanella sp. c952]
MDNKLSFSTLASTGLCLVASAGFYYFFQAEKTVTSSKMDAQSPSADDLAALQTKVARAER